MPTLCDPMRLGGLTLPNHIITAPLTQGRAAAVRMPNELMANYHAQRVSAGLILSETISVAPMGVGYVGTPGLWSEEQVHGWKLVTEVVHRAGGHIFAQLRRVGHISAPMFLGGELPVAPGAFQPSGNVSRVRPQQAYVGPRSLETVKVADVVKPSRRAAINAHEVEADGIEIRSSTSIFSNSSCKVIRIPAWIIAAVPLELAIV